MAASAKCLSLFVTLLFPRLPSRAVAVIDSAQGSGRSVLQARTE